MKTIKELAKELNLSKQAIYKKINTQLSSELEGHIFKDQNIIMVDDIGIEVIKNSILDVSPPEQVSSAFQPEKIQSDTSLATNYIASLENQIDKLENQIYKKDNLILKQQTTIDELVNKIGNMQVLLKTEQEKNLIAQHIEKTEALEEKVPAQKKSFFQRLFGK